MCCSCMAHIGLASTSTSSSLHHKTWSVLSSDVRRPPTHTIRHAQIVTKYQHNDLFPVGMSFLPDKSGRYLVADRNGKVWIGDPTEATTLQVYMEFPDCFVKDEVCIATVLPRSHLCSTFSKPPSSPMRISLSGFGSLPGCESMPQHHGACLNSD